MANIKGAATGALGGAAAGAALGPIGAGAGALLGGAVGMFGGGDNTAPQMPPIVDPVTGQQLQQANTNTQSGLSQQQAFVNALNAQNGIGNQSQVYNQLQGIAAGTGPNPAQAMLAQATGANVANQAALMAGQRGAGANAGMIARQAANQGANIQQQAAGQGATMQANQSLNAIGAAGNMANQQVGQQANAIGNYNQFAQGAQGMLLGAQGQYNNAVTGGQGNVNNNNQNVAQMNANQTGGLLNGAGAAATALGGMTKSTQAPVAAGIPMADTARGTQGPLRPDGSFAEGGAVGPSSFVGRHLSGKPQMLAQGGKVDAILSPGEVYVAPDKVKAKDPIAAGKKIPGKPKHPGNDYRNDVVPKKLQEGGIVIPNEVMQSKDPHAAAAKFVAAILAKQGPRK